MLNDESPESKFHHYINMLNDIGIALSTAEDHHQLLIKILGSAMDLLNTDAGTLYLLEDSALSFEIFANRTLQIEPRRVAEKDFPVRSIPLYDAKGAPNLANVVSYCVLKNQTQNIKDAYLTKDFDFSGMRKVDAKLGYRSKSFLAIPLRNHENKIIGVLQLINAIHKKTGEITAFDQEQVRLAESLASQAAISLTKQELILAQKKLFEALLQLIAKAIDEKSPYTSNHCRRVPIITMMIAKAANAVETGPLKDFHLSTDQMEEVRIAAWLHDCGKIITPEYVMDKSTKLTGLFDRIEVINHRFEILKRDIKIALLEKCLNGNAGADNTLEQQYQQAIAPLLQMQTTLNKINLGGESLAENDKKMITALAEKNIQLNDGTHAFLSTDDVKNLSIFRGTLNDNERQVIMNHVSVTQKMLASLPYPDYLKNVPEIAGNHHERMDGKGYPKGLTGQSMSLQSRMVAISDIFEALTASDRPYKKPNTLKETLKIMTDFKNNGHIDPDLFDLFVEKKIYLDYAKEFLKPEQIDIN